MSKIIATCPRFFVKDLRAAVDHDHEVFGFTKPRLWGDPPGFAMPSRDDFIVMLNQVGGYLLAFAEDLHPDGEKGD